MYRFSVNSVMCAYFPLDDIWDVCHVYENNNFHQFIVEDFF